MGNKFSCGRVVVYCGCPPQRKKAKKREKEKAEIAAAQEAYEAYLRAEKFKADHPEYMREVYTHRARMAQEELLRLCRMKSDSDVYLPAYSSIQSSAVQLDQTDDGALPFSGLPATDNSPVGISFNVLRLWICNSVRVGCLC